jgi:hypothetical protein
MVPKTASAFQVLGFIHFPFQRTERVRVELSDSFRVLSSIHNLENEAIRNRFS